MTALRAALAAYRDGWARVLHAPRILALLIGATILITAVGADGPPEAHPRVLDVFQGLGTALMGGAVAAALDAANVTGRLGSEEAPWVLWLLVVIGGVVLTGGVMDRYARQRPLDARAFWGVSGELAFRLIRLSALGGLLFSVLTGVLIVVLDAIADAILGPDGQGPGSVVLGLSLGLGALYLAFAVAVFAATDGGRVRMVVERRRSALFAFTAGARFAWRHCGAVTVLYASLFATAAIPWALISGVEVWLEPATVAARVLDAIQVSSTITAALVSAAAAVAFFQASLAHATYVAPPPLVWPDSPAIETLGPPRRDFPPAV
ncbi:MAG: hypothetical protein ABIT71_10560 [Vicinamibacteraceae bacterium]